MKIEFGGRNFEFRPWKPVLGKVFTGAFTFDCETARISDEFPWLTPPYVLGAAFGGAEGYFVTRDHAPAFLAAHPGEQLVFHHAPFDLAVLAQLCGAGFDGYDRVDANRVWDTLLLHKLFVLGTEGHTADRPGESTLEACVTRYLQLELPKDVRGANGKDVRTSYGRWLTREPSEIEPVYLEYLARDTVATWGVFRRLRALITSLGTVARTVWGFVSGAWLERCWERYGPLTHHVQLKGAIALQAVTTNGLRIDVAARERLVPVLECERNRLRTSLRSQGCLVSGAGSNKSLQTKLQKLEGQYPGIAFPRTDGAAYATSADALSELVGAVPFVDDLLAHRAVDKLLSSFVAKLDRAEVHPSFRTLTRTGRTSSFGDLNAQNLPRDDRVRSCFVPRPGHVFLDLDYKTIELVCLAQACRSQFGLRSHMGELINAGKDLHRELAARVTGKPEHEVTDDERGKVKAVNFGKPGGMGDRALRAYARATYGVEYTEDEASELSEYWLDQFPEMRAFLADAVNVPERLAHGLDLTAVAHAEETGDARLVRHPENRAREHEPNQVLGMMCLKVLGHENPTTGAGRPYSAEDLEFFWSRLERVSGELAPKHARALRSRQPSPALQRAVASHFGRAGVFTLTGRLRAGASYTARHNTIFQGPASDGAKLALWRVWRAGYRVVNFVHDQLLVEVPAGADLAAHAERIKVEMIAGMADVVPEVKVDVDFAASERWHKKAKAVFDANGRLVPWVPAGGLESAPPGATGSHREVTAPSPSQMSVAAIGLELNR
ncbi:hypothetical protein J8F10_16415 [Gemmata sp. G18]|uniref:DNA-directed DNA polymerase n=1 Tax=Gemmata palustris TaxID=2822762 RepID=A0ABS5BSZ7_9BACT|nr:DNA polymerase [Gemmata palustris]MBP3956857.1 hypothetical protein [Gemmata palustris]